MFKTFLQILLFLILIPVSSFALQNNRKIDGDFMFAPKTVTPNRLFTAELSAPAEFTSTNNLVRKTGSFYTAIGEVIYVQGKITDSFDVPISGAIVEIWQTNSSGKYQSLIEKSSQHYDDNFAMSGRAVTDNLGNYYFVTIMPGFYLSRAPHINVNISHPKFGKVETEMYFEKHPRNREDYQYVSYNRKERDLLTAKVRLSDIFNPRSAKICTFNIVMNGIHKYKSLGSSI